MDKNNFYDFDNIEDYTQFLKLEKDYQELQMRYNNVLRIESNMIVNDIMFKMEIKNLEDECNNLSAKISSVEEKYKCLLNETAYQEPQSDTQESNEEKGGFLHWVMREFPYDYILSQILLIIIVSVLVSFCC